jgi:pyrophosphatase PpaX
MKERNGFRDVGSARIRAVLFDFDGTLADSTELIMHSFRHTMARHLDAVPPDEEWMSGFGTPLDVQLGRFARSEAEREAMLDTYRSFQQEHYDTLLRPFPGAPDLVAELARRGVPMGVVTSRYRRSTLRGMELCGMLDHIPVVVTPEDVASPKPHPEPVLHALQRLAIAAEEAVFVGDSPHDIHAGRAAGTWTAGVLWGPFPHATLEAAQPDFLLDAQEDVLGLLVGERRRNGSG